MNEVTIFQCNYCNKTSFNKCRMKVHEKKCYHNPTTQSCATCLWFSRKHFEGPQIRCLVGEVFATVNEINTILNTNCNKWINSELVEDIEIFDNEFGILDHLLTGDIEVLNIIAGIKANGTSYYNWKLDQVTG